MIENGMAKDEDVKSFAARISEQAGRLLNIIADIIRLSEFDEADAKEARKELAEFDIRELAQEVIGSLGENGRGIAVKLAGEEIRVRANRRMIDELLCNLIDNAIKYNVENGSVKVSLSKEGGFCKLEVANTGPGIPEEHQGRVFERFYRVDKSRTKKTGGTGLGLSIVKHIAAYHGGRAELASTPGKGTTVTCYLAV
jgi:two-component system phosphate regulon sensor histidine kinase PhoR